MSRPIEDITRVTELQAGMLFHAAEDPSGPDPYTVQIALELAGSIDEHRWRRAVTALVAHHPALRTLFVRAGTDDPVAVVRAAAAPEWTVLDLGAGPDAEARSAAHGDDERARRFALDREIPLRGALHRTGPERARLVLTLHHLVVDGWSVPVLLEDLVALHAANGDPAGLAPSPPFGRYLRWVDAQDGEAALAAWAQDLAGVEPLRVAERAAAPAARPTRRELELDEATTAGLAELARRAGATPATVVRLAWGLVLARHSGRREAVFGATVSGRPPELDGVERVVGLFVNTLPVRVPAAPQARVGDLLAELTGRVTDLLAHQYVGLAALQRRVGRGALFDTTLVVENLPGGAGDDHTGGADAGAGTTVLDVDARDSTHYPLTVVALPGPRWRVRLDHHPDLLDPAIAARLADGLDRVLHGLAAAAPEDRLATVALVDDATRDRVRARGTGAAVVVPDATLPGLLSAAAARHGDRPAVVAADGTVHRYDALHAHARRVARALLARGVGPDTVVALAMPRGPELMVALVAVQLAGAAYLPVDPDAPAERERALLDDARPAAVLVTPAGAARLPDALVVDIADVVPDPAPLAAAVPDPAHLAYVIYTSGSTGRPKGVAVDHRAIVNRLAWMQDSHPLAPGDRVLQKTPASFDVSVWELFWPLLHGAVVVLAAPGEHRDPAALARRIVDERIATVHFVPTMLAAFLDVLDTDAAATVDATLTRVVCSGEGLPPALRDRCHRLLPSVALHNLYGPTEAAVDVTAVALRPGDAAAGDEVPIGGPVWNTGVRVLDAALDDVAVGVVGELHLTGVQLARGYRGRPGLTADRFVADPAGPPGARMYRTGDLARWGDDGLLRHVGRVDDQVKIRGQRVEPGESEAALAALPGVRAAAVVTRPDSGGASSLVGYAVTDVPDPAPADRDDLRAALAERLPEALVPAAVVGLPELPVGAHGKLDRAALPAPRRVAGAGRGARTRTEAVVCGVFAGALGLDRVGADDDFFALGGHSLLAMRVVAELTRALGVGVEVGALLAAPTPAALAARLADPDRVEGSPLDPLLALRPAGGATPLFCVHPAAGLSWCYLGLLPTLDPDVPVWGLQAPELSGADDGPRSLAERAAACVEQVRRVAPRGPYRLLGWSVGGRIAHEMAARLEAQGETVELLTVLDAYPRTTLTDAGTEAVLADAGRDLPATGTDVATVRAELGDPDWLDDATTERVLATYVATTGALVGATPAVVAAPVLLFHTERPASPAYRPDQWREHVLGALTCVPVACRHEEMGSPAVLAEVGRTVTRTLADRAHSSGTTAGTR